MKSKLVTCLVACMTLSAAHAAPDLAAAYPERPVTVIVPFAAGGASTVMGRVVAEKMAKLLGQSFVVDNRTGAGGAIGMRYVASAKPDGYTLGIASVSTHVTGPACNPNTTYDPVKDFAPVSNLAKSPKLIAVNAKVPVRNFQELVALLKAQPGQHSFANAGVCSIGHLLGVQLQTLAGIDFVHVPYRGGAPALSDVVANQLPVLIDNLPPAMPFIKSGVLRPLVISWPGPMAELPGVPTFAAVGLAAVNQPTWQGLVAPAGTPPAILDKLSRAAQEALRDPEVARVIRDTGAEPAGNSPAEFAAEIREQYSTTKALTEREHITAEP